MTKQEEEVTWESVRLTSGSAESHTQQGKVRELQGKWGNVGGLPGKLGMLWDYSRNREMLGNCEEVHGCTSCQWDVRKGSSSHKGGEMRREGGRGNKNR